jgi:hypothetical protein
MYLPMKEKEKMGEREKRITPRGHLVINPKPYK